MSFIDLFGGQWTPKEAKPSAELMEKREKQAVLLQYPHSYIHNLREHFVKGGPRPTAFLKDNGDGSFSWGLVTDKCDTARSMVFKLDGKSTQVNRMIDGRPVQFTNTIQDNTWVTEVVTDGSPEMKVLHKRAGDELHVKETLGDLEIHDVWVKVAESD